MAWKGVHLTQSARLSLPDGQLLREAGRERGSHCAGRLEWIVIDAGYAIELADDRLHGGGRCTGGYQRAPHSFRFTLPLIVTIDNVQWQSSRLRRRNV